MEIVPKSGLLENDPRAPRALLDAVIRGRRLASPTQARFRNATRRNDARTGRIAVPFAPLMVGCFLSGNDVSSEQAFCLESIKRLL
jgi:hypothetical protein